MTLSIPRITDETDVLRAAMMYADCGWYVGPVARGTKNPGSVLGARWQDKTSRDREQIVEWFAGTSHGVFLHAGRSGAVIFDIDHPENIPPVLESAIDQYCSPFQSTRLEDLARGHAIFECPPGRRIGNSVGALGHGWGEVRGLNGVIVAAPTVHPDPAGHYAWSYVGPVPVLPGELDALLPTADPGVDALSDAAVAALVAEHQGEASPGAITTVRAEFGRLVTAGASRHDAMVTAACWAAREALAGAYPLGLAMNALRVDFIVAMVRPRAGHRAISPMQAQNEFESIMAWALGQATPDRVAEVAGRLAVPFNLQGVITEFHPPVQSPVATAEPATGDDPERTAYDVMVDQEMQRLRLRRDAKRLLDEQEAADRFRTPETFTLKQLLESPDEPLTFTITDCLPEGSNVVLTAQFKSGKTTLINHMAKCLADGLPFLKKFPVLADSGNVGIWNYEVSQQMITRWLRDSEIANTERIVTLNLRGYSIPILSERGQEFMIQWLAEHEIRHWVLDPWARAISGLDENSNHDVGRVLDVLDEIKEKAGVLNLIVPNHTGRGIAEEGNERARGATRLDDWCDIRWILTVKDDVRYFRAHGRDVDVPEGTIDWHAPTRGYALTAGDRATARAERNAGTLRPDGGVSGALADRIMIGVRSNPGVSQNALTVILGVGRNVLPKALEIMEEQGLVRIEPGANRSKLIYPSATAQASAGGTE